MIEKIKEKWDEILLHIKEEHELTDVSFKTWLLPTQPYSMKDGTLQILVPDVQFLGYIKKKYGLLIQITIEELTGIECEVDFVTIEQVDEPQKETDKSHLINRPSEVSRQLIQDANLNPRYTFDTFVVGANNNLAHAASLAVAESPDISYTVVPCAASASNSSTGVLRREAISSTNAPVPPAQLPFIRISATCSSPVRLSLWKKIIFASCPPSSIAVPISPYMAFKAIEFATTSCT